MAALTFQRASWSLEISRSSRFLTISFATALPRTSKTRHLPSVHSSLFHSRANNFQFSRNQSSKKSDKHSEARRKFSTTNFHRAQQSEQNSAATKKTSLDTQSPPVPETIYTDAKDLTGGLNEQTETLEDGSQHIDWTRSFHGLSSEAFSPEAAKILLAPIDPDDIELKPDGIIYLPEIKYRRILNRAFGPGAWGLAPRGDTIVTAKAVTREYALVAHGRLVSVARGEQDYFTPEGIPTAVEGCKSSALRRCCKDLGVASELWDPKFIRQFMAKNAKEVFVEHQQTKKRRKMFLRKDDTVKYPFKETKYGA